jgi:hypothetical protein
MGKDESFLEWITRVILAVMMNFSVGIIIGCLAFIFSLYELISSYNPSLGVVTMVPNSLGPGELIQHYGTEDQKNFYLPLLSNGTFIPCFGLTGPNNGSDAVGQIDTGIVELVDGKIKIKVTLNKRYITLAPVSNLMGIAFNLTDPNNLLNSKKNGITVALVEKNHYHNPNNSGFPNGTIKGTIYIDPDQVIGGEQNIGEGWKMLMECLAVGRGVSLPATANGSSKYITYAIMNYINLRKQFNMNIGNMVFSLNFEINKNSIYISDIKISDDYYDNTYTGNIKRSYTNDVFNIDDIINNYIIKYHTDQEINKITININNNLDKYSEELDKLGFVLNLTSYSGKLEKIIKDKINNNNNNKINNNDSPII